jgi:hypothetical protein
MIYEDVTPRTPRISWYGDSRDIANLTELRSTTLHENATRGAMVSGLDF